MSSKPVSIKFTDLSDALDFVSGGQELDCRAYISRANGAVYLLADGMDEEVPDDIEDSEDYIPVPRKNDLDLGRDLVLSFVADELPDEIDEVAAMFRRKGAYGKFKQFLHAHNAVDKWYAFEERAVERALREWCEAEGFEVRDS